MLVIMIVFSIIVVVLCGLKKIEFVVLKVMMFIYR